MKEGEYSVKVFGVVFAIFSIGYSIIVFTSRLYPFVDLPNHLAAATILRYFHSGTNQFPVFFTIPTVWAPNTFHLFFCSLSVFPSVEYANRLLLVIYTLTLPLLCLVIIRKLGGNLWFSLLSFIFLFNFSMSWGFVSYALSIPLVLLLVFILVRSIGNSSVVNACLSAIMLFALFFFHALALVLGLLIYGSYIYYKVVSKIKTSWIEFAVPIPALAILIGWWLPMSRYNGSGTSGFLLNYYLHEYLQTGLRRGAILVFDNFSLFYGIRGYLVGLLFTSICLVLLAILILRNHHEIRGIVHKRKGLGFLVILILLSGGCCLFLPNRLPNQHFLYERFSVYLFLFIIIFIASLGKQLNSRFWVLLICGLVFVHFVLYAQYFNEFNRVNHGFTSDLFPCDNREAVLAALPFDDRFRGQHAYFHFQDYYIVWCQGIAVNSFVDFRFGTVRRRAGTDLLPIHDPWRLASPEIYLQYRNIDYILVKGNLPPNVAEMLAQFKIMARSGNWKLYQHPD